MQPTLVHAGVMDSQKPPLEFTLPVKHLNGFDRFRRGLLRMLMISIPGALITIIPPHPCGMFIALIVGPVMGIITALDKAVFGEATITCPKCSEPLPLPAKLTGWPARFSCPKCKAMIEIRMPAKELKP
jgi:hypothetical protein